jgi:hypothetical protein
MQCQRLNQARSVLSYSRSTKLFVSDIIFYGGKWREMWQNCGKTVEHKLKCGKTVAKPLSTNFSREVEQGSLQAKITIF